MAGGFACAAGGVEVGLACAAAAASLAASAEGSGLLEASGLLAGAGLLSDTVGMLTREAGATPGGCALGDTANGSERTGGNDALDDGTGVFGAAAGGDDAGDEAAAGDDADTVDGAGDDGRGGVGAAAGDDVDAAGDDVDGAGDDGRGGVGAAAGEDDGAGVDGRRSVGAASEDGPSDVGRGGTGVETAGFAAAAGGVVRGTNPDASRAPKPADGGPDEGRGVTPVPAGGDDDVGRGAAGTGDGAFTGDDSVFSEDGTISAGVVRGNEPKMSSSSPHPESTFCSSFLSNAAGAGLLTGRGATLGAAGDVSQAESKLSLSAVLIGGDSASFMSASDGENGRTNEAMVRRPGAL